MIPQKHITTRFFDPFALALLSFVSLQPTLSVAQKGVLLDQGGAVFNVKAYGATADDKTDDTSAIQSAIDAATKAGGGVVYFPAGSYVLNGTLHDDRADMVSLVGAGMASRLSIRSKLGISLASTASHTGDSGYHGGRIQSLYIHCTNRQDGIAVQMTDMVGSLSLNDLTISNCDQAFDIINQAYWNERLAVNNLTDNYNNHLFHYHQNPKLDTNSYGYGTYDGIFINKAPGQDVFYLTGGAYLYQTTFIVKGNISGDTKNPAAIFHIHGAAGEPCPSAQYNLMDIAVEGEFYSIVKISDTGCKGGPAGNPFVGGIGFISAIGSTPGDRNFISDPKNASYLAATFTATNSSSDSVHAMNATPTCKCYVQPTNAIAANAIVGTYVSATTWQTVTVTHPPTANKGQYQIWCTP